jgi:hypothetical protein
MEQTSGRPPLQAGAYPKPAGQAVAGEPHASPVAQVFDGPRPVDRVCMSLASGYRPCEGDNLEAMP